MERDDIGVSDIEQLRRLCPQVRDILGFTGDKWSLLSVAALGTGALRFNEIQRRLDGVSQRMLARTLKGLERDGLVARSVTPTTPPSVSYALTPLGSTLLAPVAALARWADTSSDAILAARSRFGGTGEAQG